MVQKIPAKVFTFYLSSKKKNALFYDLVHVLYVCNLFIKYL